jgi:hypothetical protein
MRKSILIIVIAAVSTLTTMLVAERQYSLRIEESSRIAQPDPTSSTVLSASDESPSTANLDAGN